MKNIYIILCLFFVFSTITNILLSKLFSKNLKTNYYGSKNKKKIIKIFNKKIRKNERKELRITEKRKKFIERKKKRNLDHKDPTKKCVNKLNENIKISQNKYIIVGAEKNDNKLNCKNSNNNILY